MIRKTNRKIMRILMSF